MSKSQISLVALIALITMLLAACQPADSQPSPATPEPPVAQRATATVTAVPSATEAAPTPSRTPTAPPTATATPEPTATATPTPTPHLDLRPATLDIEHAANFVAGVEYMDPAMFAGRVFHDEATGATILLSQALYDAITLGVENPDPDQLAQTLMQSEWGQLLDLHTNPARRERSNGLLRFNYQELVIWEPGGRVYAWNYENYSRTHQVFRLRPDGTRQVFRSNFTLPRTRDRPLVRWAEGLGLVLTNGWRVSHHYEPQEAQWRALELPVELTTDRAEQARIMADLLRELPGYFNSRPYVFNDWITTNDGQMLIAVGGRNGLPEQQAHTLKRWIDWALDNSPEFRQVYQEGDVRWMVRDDAYLDRRDWGASPDAVATNWGIIFHESNSRAMSSGLMGWNVQLIVHETSRIWNEAQQAGCGVNNQMTVEVESRLLQSFRDLYSAADWDAANYILNLHQAQRNRPCARLG